MYHGSTNAEATLIVNARNGSLSILTPILIWMAIIVSYTVNIPWFDDFDPFPDFLRKWTTTTDVWESFQLILQPNNEHRMLSGKLITLGLYQLTGKLDLSSIQIIGALFLIGACALIYKTFLLLKLPRIYFLPVPLLLFQFQFHLIFLWAICSMQHQTAVFFLCLSMYLLARRKLSWAIMAAVLGNFSFSNGMFIWPAGLVVLLLRKDFKQATVWTLFSILSIGSYLHDMPAQGNETGIAYNIQNPHMFFIGFWGFLGSLFELVPRSLTLATRIALPVIVGAIATSIMIIWLFKAASPFLQTVFNRLQSISKYFSSGNTGRFQDRRFLDFCIGILTFSLVTGVVVGFLRPRFGLEVVLVSNYKLYSALFLAISYLIFLGYSYEKPFQKKGVIAFSSIALLIWGMSYWLVMPEIIERRKYLLINAYNQQHNQFGLGFARKTPAAIYTDSLMQYVQEKGIYSYPTTYQYLFDEMKRTDYRYPTLNIEWKQEGTDIRLTQLNSPFKWSMNDGSVAFLRSKNALYVYKLDQATYQGKNLFRQFEKYKSIQFTTQGIDRGMYELGIATIDNNQLVAGIIDTVVIR